MKRLRKRRNTTVGLHLRAGLVLDYAQGYSGEEMAERHGISQQTVSKWRNRFIEQRLSGLTDTPRSGQPRKHDDDRVQEILDYTLNHTPNNATHWSVRRFSEQTGFDRGIVHREWTAFGLKPHLAKRFKLSNDPHFVEKVRDLVGLYMTPPDKALVLCVDEQSQIQALDRTQPSLPTHYGMSETDTQDYQRFGTTTVFAALDVVIGQLKRTHRSDEFLRFLRRINQRTPDDLEVHLIMDNYGIHKTHEGEALVCSTPTLSWSLHPHLQLLVESGRAVLRQAQRRTAASRH